MKGFLMRLCYRRRGGLLLMGVLLVCLLFLLFPPEAWRRRGRGDQPGPSRRREETDGGLGFGRDLDDFLPQERPGNRRKTQKFSSPASGFGPDDDGSVEGGDKPDPFPRVADAADADADPSRSSAQQPLLPTGVLQEIPCVINAQVLQNIGGRLPANQEEAGPSKKAGPVGVAETSEEGRTVPCLLAEGQAEVYVPYSFVKQYFDIYGEVLQETNGSRTFQWSHSYAKVFPQFRERPYNATGAFLQFDSFEVEYRPRVKCVTAEEGVPLSTQWDKSGYYYSTQISQYALSHYSKHLLLANHARQLTNGEPVPRPSRTVYEDGVLHFGDWRGDLTRVLSLKCVHFDTASDISLDLDDVEVGGPAGRPREEYILDLDLQFRQNVTISVTLTSNKIAYVLRYVHADFHVRRDGNVVSYGYGTSGLSEGDWKPLTRDLLNDLQKGVSRRAYAGFAAQQPPPRVTRLELEGVGCVTNISLSANGGHLRRFFAAADWLARNQDENGGWPAGVVFNKDKKKYPLAEELQDGWYSAMAQGHALSVLTRAHHVSGDVKYLECAVRALELFGISSRDGGLAAAFLDKYPWYEEYPTRPSTFVLNGFMYSLLGLYDLHASLKTQNGYDEAAKMSLELLRQGLGSLDVMLPLFDTGSGSVYDLRHVTMRPTEPKVARWDYHATHVNLLYVLSTLDVGGDDDDKVIFLRKTADRWRDYMLGKRVEHN